MEWGVLLRMCFRFENESGMGQGSFSLGGFGMFGAALLSRLLMQV